ncbi:DNA topoisomerase III [Ramlibacter alkalitolerans]|uniref:DNA topoisomerase n=2 Tax=Ramlibacter alkalitolerans TaxID=2039631 RepID=A0ABS1JU62_9BURK|nr:DNA topoisomerase III [Ramlibacter alkalitolerans]
MTTLFIAEKPSMGRAIAARLKPVRNAPGFIECAGGKIVTWCVGHVFENAAPDDYDEELKKWSFDALPIVPKSWKLLPKDSAKAQIRVIKDLLAKATNVVHAGDADQEGELLVYEPLEQLKYKGPVQRLWLSAMDDASIDKALATLKPGAATYPLKTAAEARSRVDWLIGMNLTRAYTLAGRRAGGQGVLSVGRVQTPTLGLVVRRDLAIENFKPRDYFEVFGTFKVGATNVRAKWLSPKEGAGIDEEGRLLDRKVADALVAKVTGRPGKVSAFESKKQSQGAPLPFSLSALQSAASAKFGMSAQKVLDTCQALYETHKLTTYPRSDCQYLPDSMHAEAPTVLRAIAKSYPALAALAGRASASKKSGAFNDKKVSAHHAIIPTLSGGDTSRLSKDEQQIYDLICRHYVAQFFPDFDYLQNSVEFETMGEKFAATGRQVLKPGWKEVFGASADEEDDDQDKQAIPTCSKGDSAPCVKAEVAAKQTKPPARFTEGTLIKAMANIQAFVTDPAIKKLLKESAGIGTEATRASILETLKNRKFLETKGKQLISTPAARALIAALPAVLTQPDLTAIFEQRLEEIRQGASSDEFLTKQVAFVTKLVGDAKGSSVSVVAAPQYKCPICDKALRRIPKSPGGFFWGCSGYRETGCKGSASDKNGKPDFGSGGAKPSYPAKGSSSSSSPKPAHRPAFKKK